jgi:hypothetical protein
MGIVREESEGKGKVRLCHSCVDRNHDSNPMTMMMVKGRGGRGNRRSGGGGGW